jgi:hypothetical protein
LRTLADGTVIYLTQEPYRTRDNDVLRYTAQAIDADGTSYAVLWPPLNEDDEEDAEEVEEESACDWSVFTVILA